MTDSTAEILDGSSTMVEENLDFWIGQSRQGRIGSWTNTVTAEISAPVIDKIRPRQCLPGEKVRIIGFGFGDGSGGSFIHIGPNTYDVDSSRTKASTETEVRVKTPFQGKDCAWFTQADGTCRK